MLTFYLWIKLSFFFFSLLRAAKGLGYTLLSREYIWAKFSQSHTSSLNKNEMLLRVYEVALIFRKADRKLPEELDRYRIHFFTTYIVMHSIIIQIMYIHF